MIFQNIDNKGVSEYTPIIKKGWGREIWCHNSEKYCSKILMFDKKGNRCSNHFHLKKTETWYIKTGKFSLDYFNLDTGTQLTKTLTPGCIVTISPGEPHQLTSLEDNSIIFECSTQHFDNDSYRVAPGNSQEQTIFTNGCFDIIHEGHVKLLKYCKSLGRVVVGLNSDKSVRELKGAGRPVNSQEQRMLVLESLKFVDEVHIFDELTPLRLVKELKPDIIVKGGDYKIQDVVGKDEVKKVIIFNTVKGVSTTSLIKKMKS